MEQIEAAYKKMARFYRPAAPSDGYTHITVPEDELDLDAEARAYAVDWWESEDGGDGSYLIGYPRLADPPGDDLRHRGRADAVRREAR